MSGNPQKHVLIVKNREKVKINKMGGFSRSVNVKREDVDFILAVDQWVKKNDESFSSVVSVALKYYFISAGPLFEGFRKILAEITDESLEDTWVIYLGQRRKLKDILDDEFIIPVNPKI